MHLEVVTEMSWENSVFLGVTTMWMVLGAFMLFVLVRGEGLRWVVLWWTLVNIAGVIGGGISTSINGGSVENFYGGFWPGLAIGIIPSIIVCATISWLARMWQRHRVGAKLLAYFFKYVDRMPDNILWWPMKK